MTPSPDMRKYFAQLLAEEMRSNQRVWLVTGDLGFGLWDEVRDCFPNRFVNTGAAEQAMMGVAVGLALSGQIPFVYSITPFLLYRPFETIRNYLHHEQTPVKLVGSGRDKDYENEGFSHWAEDDKKVLESLPNINTAWPTTNADLKKVFTTMVQQPAPWYVNLKRG